MHFRCFTPCDFLLNKNIILKYAYAHGLYDMSLNTFFHVPDNIQVKLANQEKLFGSLSTICIISDSIWTLLWCSCLVQCWQTDI